MRHHDVYRLTSQGQSQKIKRAIYYKLGFAFISFSGIAYR